MIHEFIIKDGEAKPRSIRLMADSTSDALKRLANDLKERYSDNTVIVSHQVTE